MKEDEDVINSLRKSNYLKAGSLYLIGTIFNKGLVFITIPIFTRILTTGEYGILNTYTSWVTVFISVVGLSLDMAVLIGFSDYEHDIDSFMTTITTLTLINSLIFSIFVVSVVAIFNINLEISFFLLLIALVQSLAHAILKNYDMYLKFKYQYIKKSALEILPNVFTLISAIFLILYFVTQDKHIGKIIPHAVYMSSFSIVILLIIYKKSSCFNKTYAKIALKVSVPFIFHSFSMTLLNQSDRLMLTSMVNAVETGIYSLIYNFSMAVTVIFISLDNVWLPWFTTKLKQGDIEAINDKARVYFFIITIPIVGLTFISPELLRIIAPREYWLADTSIPLIILGSYTMFIYSLYVKVEYFHKQSKTVAMNTLLAAFVNIGLNYFAINWFGFRGAAMTTLISYLTLLFLHYKAARKLEKNLLPINLIIKPVTYVAINTIIFYIVIDFGVLRWIILTLQLLYISLYNKKWALNLIKKDD